MNVTVPDILAEKKRRSLWHRRLDAGPAGMAETLSGGRWKAHPHLMVLSDALRRAATLPDQRILLSMPPRHGKSEETSAWFPAWYLSLFPERKVLLASYEANFARSWGRRARDLLLEHHGRVGVELSADVTAADEWQTTQGGGMFTAGVGGPFTGKGGHLLLVDDPIKNEEEALSQAYRERLWSWWTSTAYTRLEPGGSAVVVMTRWHEDDLAGRLLEQEKDGGEHWEVINLPALAEKGDQLGRAEGEPLWPGRYDRAALERIKLAVGQRVWNALYQGHPAPEAGGMFKRDWWRYWRRANEAESADPKIRENTIVIDPKRLQAYWQSWDCAFEGKKTSDPVCGGAWGMAGPKRFLLDAEWGHMDFVATVGALRRLSKRWPEATAKLIENKANGPAVISSLQAEVEGLISINPKGSKQARAAAVTPLVEAHNVYLPLHHAKRSAMVEEAAGFPTGKNDDFVDMLSQALARTLGWNLPQDEPPPPTGSPAWEERMEDEAGQRNDEEGDLW